MPTASRSSSKQRAKRAARVQQRGAASLLERLSDVAAEDAWVISCYLKLEPRDRARGKYLIKLKNRMRDRLAWCEDQGMSREDRQQVAADLERIRDYLSQPSNIPTGQGIALFASKPLDLFEAIPLPRVFRSRLAVARTPLIRELVALDDEFGLVLCAVCDRTSARIFSVTAFEVRELEDLTAPDRPRAGKFHGTRSFGAAGKGITAAGEHNYHQRMREERQRHFAAVAERLFGLSRGVPVQGIVLAGVGADAGAIVPHIHPYLADRVLGTARLNPKHATPAAVMEAVLAVRSQRERDWEAEHVRRLEETVGARWAVNGTRPTLDALARGQVRTLLVRPDASARGYRCGGNGGRLTVVEEDCGGDRPVPVADVVDDAIEEALRQGSHVDVIEDATARDAVDGLAALLRFKLP